MRYTLFLIPIMHLFFVLTGSANIKLISDTSKPISIKLDARNQKTDSNVLIVVNRQIIGTIRDFKKGIDSLVPVDSIKSINVLKDSAAVTLYGEKGKHGVIEIFLKDEALKIKDIKILEANENSNEIIDKVEIEASFPGGDQMWRKYIERNANGQVATDNGAPTGTYTVIVQFVVDKEGNISDVRALTKHGYGMEAEAIRVIQKGPKWTPAIQSGRMVKAYRKQPITFQVIEEKKKRKNRD
jgi:hypothetical protein